MTGSTYVGNWPGVTVEKEANYYFKGKGKDRGIDIIDLPVFILYLLTPEVISRVYIKENPDVVINVIVQLTRRNLYMTTQLLEMFLLFLL